MDNVSKMEGWEKMMRDKTKGTSEFRVSGVEEERGGEGERVENKRGRDGIEKNSGEWERDKENEGDGGRERDRECLISVLQEA